MNYKIISADVHITEPPDIWKNHLPDKYQEHAPKLVKDHEGGDAWLFAGASAPDPIDLETASVAQLQAKGGARVPADVVGRVQLDRPVQGRCGFPPLPGAGQTVDPGDPE